MRSPGRLAVALAGAVSALASVAAIGTAVASNDDATSAQDPPPPAVAESSSATAVLAVNIAQFAFAPQDSTVSIDTEITWTNEDGFAHSIRSADGSFDSADLGPGDEFAHVFDRAGTYSYICGIHNSMTGTVVVEA